MNGAGIQAAYRIFDDTLRAGGFTEPDQAFIEGNATVHLQLHLDQLRGLLS
jgi:hypothetical protein